ncbi:MAG: 2-amino-4-oxopentanoate thiolase subunit OrtA [Pseudomonadota bacterium]
MPERAEKDTWVEIHNLVLEKGQRAPQVPEDTQQVPLEMKVKGFLLQAADVGQEAEIITPAGRRLKGILTQVNPAYTHMFGRPIPELASVGREVRAILQERGRGK